MVKVTVPATSANLGPGFDCLGIALSCYATLWAEATPGEISIAGCPAEYCGPDNLAWRAFELARKTFNLPGGARLRLTSDIPVARGMGSSAALTVAGLCAAWALYRDGLPLPELLALATQLEGHPDNAAPALMGGLQSALVDAQGVHTVSHPMHASFHLMALVPPFELATKEARAALPATITRADAVFNMAHTLAVLDALREGDGVRLGRAMKDRLHEPYRYPLIKGGTAVRDLALSAGADAVCISGAGPTLLAFYREGTFPGRIGHLLAQRAPEWAALPLSVDRQGARVEAGASPVGT